MEKTHNQASTEMISASLIPEQKKRNRENTNDVDKITKGITDLIEILQKMIGAYFYISTFQAEAALKVLQSLPTSHHETTSVLDMTAKAYYELHQYHNAIEMFKKIRCFFVLLI